MINKNVSLFIITSVFLFFLSSCSNWSVTYTGDYCADNLQDRTETDVDCGGLYCDPCEEGYACEDDSDCSSESCESGVCTTETYDATTTDSDEDGVVDASDVCDGDDDTIDVDEDDIADCVDDSVEEEESVVFIGYLDGIIYALDADDGTELWTFDPHYWPESLSAINSVLYAGYIDSVYALSVVDGTQIWSFELDEGEALSSVITSDDVVYLSSSFDDDDISYVYALDANDGTELWKESVAGEVTATEATKSSIEIDDDLIYVSTYDDSNGYVGTVFALNKEDGTPQWDAEILEIPYTTIADSVVYVGSEDYVYALSGDDGAELWSIELPSGEIISEPVVANGIVYIGTWSSGAYALDADDGSIIWENTDVYGGQPFIVNDILYLGAYNGYVYALDANDGSELWSLDTGAKINKYPTYNNGILYVSNYYSLYALDPNDGSEIWAYESTETAITSPLVYTIN